MKEKIINKKIESGFFAIMSKILLREIFKAIKFYTDLLFRAGIIEIKNYIRYSHQLCVFLQSKCKNE